jgi:hypothetical protein
LKEEFLMADKFSNADLGQEISLFGKYMSCEVQTGKTVTKGDVVEAAAEVSNGLPKVQPALTGSLIVLGVALEDGVAGAVIQVATGGIVKITAGAAGTTVGKLVMVGANAGTVVDADAYGKVFGRALHTLSSGDTGLVLLD